MNRATHYVFGGWLAVVLLTASAHADLILDSGSQIIFPDGSTMSSAAPAVVPPGHGGTDNSVSISDAFVGGGSENTAEHSYSTVSGGRRNVAGAIHSTVGGGRNNTASGRLSTVGGGGAFFQGNVASGYASTVPGGYANVAAGDFSFAAGANAQAAHEGTFVWKDAGPDSLTSTSANQFLVDADGGFGINTGSPDVQFHVRDSISGPATIANHVALIENSSSAGSGDMLALKIREAEVDIGPANNFITFFDGANAGIGAIEGSSPGVSFNSSTADFAEWLPKADSVQLEPGDVVALRNGRVTKNTRHASRVFVVSTSPIVVGNDPGPELRSNYARVALVGQVPVNVRGSVLSGDFIVPSGRNDGTAVAVSAEQFRMGQATMVIGQAIGASADPGVKQIRTLVGSPTPQHVSEQIEALQQSVAEREAAITSLLARVEALEALLDEGK